MNAETGGGLTADEREALSNAIGAKIDQQFDEGEKIDIDWAIIYAADAAEAFFAARLADRDAALARLGDDRHPARRLSGGGWRSSERAPVTPLGGDGYAHRGADG
jgi:hypothetical protein